MLYKRLSKDVRTVYVTEGQSDCIRLLDYGLEDSSSLCVAISGASQFLPAWAELFRGKKVFLVPDIDAAGQILGDRLKSIIAPVALEVHILDITCPGSARIGKSSQHSSGIKTLGENLVFSSPT